MQRPDNLKIGDKFILTSSVRWDGRPDGRFDSVIGSIVELTQDDGSGSPYFTIHTSVDLPRGNTTRCINFRSLSPLFSINFFSQLNLIPC